MACCLDVAGFITDIENFRWGQFYFPKNAADFTSFSKKLRGAAYKLEIGKMMTGEKDFHVVLGIGGEYGHPFAPGMQRGEGFGNSGDRLHLMNPLMEKLETAPGNGGHLPFVDAEMADEFPGIHPASLFKLSLRKFPKVELPGHVIENGVADGAGVGQCPVKIKKNHAGSIGSTPDGWGREAHGWNWIFIAMSLTQAMLPLRDDPDAVRFSNMM